MIQQYLHVQLQQSTDRKWGCNSNKMVPVHHVSVEANELKTIQANKQLQGTPYWLNVCLLMISFWLNYIEMHEHYSDPA
jgi:hypothetical protein